jgi:hypothetical protein
LGWVTYGSSRLTPLDKLWLKNVKTIFKKAKLNSIKQIRLVRLSKKNYFGNQTMTFKNSNENMIYEAVTDTNDSSYLVTLDQIYDIYLEKKIGYMVKVTALLIWLLV